MTVLRLTLFALALPLVGCAGPTQIQREVSRLGDNMDTEPAEPDDETALSASRNEPPEPALALPTTGHLQLADSTDRTRRLFGMAPRLLTPWDYSLAEHDLEFAQLEVVVRYADLEPTPGLAVDRHPQQHRSLLVGLRFDPWGLSDDTDPDGL